MNILVSLKDFIGTREDREKLWILLRMTFTFALQFLGEGFLMPMVIAFVGHLGEIELAAAAISASLYFGIVGSILRGLSSGHDTFFAQAFGTGQKKLFGVLALRALVLQAFCASLMMPIYLNIELILIKFGLDRQVSSLVGEFFLWYCPGIYMLQVWIVLSKFLACQNRDVTASLSTGCGLAICAVCLYISVVHFGGGVWCGGLSLTLTWTALNVIGMVIIIFDGTFSSYWPGFTSLAFDNMWHLAKYCINAMAVMMIDWGAFQLLSILSAWLGTREAAAQGIFTSVYMIITCVEIGMMCATGVQVGQSVGRRDHKSAAWLTRAAFLAIIICGLISIPLLIAFRNIFPRIFTSSEEVIKISASLAPLMGVLVLTDGINYIGRGINRATGMLTMALVVGIVAIILTGLPLSIYLMFFTSLSTKGTWLGLSCALAASGVFYIIYYCFYADWQDLIKKGKERTKISAKEDHSERLPILATTSKDEDTESKTQNNQGFNDSDGTNISINEDTSEELPADTFNGKTQGNDTLRLRGFIMLFTALGFLATGIIIRCTVSTELITSSIENSTLLLPQDSELWNMTLGYL